MNDMMCIDVLMCETNESIANEIVNIIRFFISSFLFSVATSIPAMAIMIAEQPTVGVSYRENHAATSDEMMTIGIVYL